MSSSLLSFLSPSKIEESIPEGVMPSSVSSASVVQFRNRVRYIPTSGATYAVPGGSKIVQFRITGNDYLDMSTASLHFKLQCLGSANATILQEGAYSVIQRVRVALNSVVVQDTDQAHIVANSKVLNTMPRQVYDTDGFYMGLYKRSKALTINPATFSAPTLSNLLPVISGYYTASSEPNGTSFVVPMSLIASCFAMKTFLPLRNVGSLEISLFLEDPATCLFLGAGTTVGTYQLNDVSIEVDSVQLASPIVQLMDRLASDVSETGGVVIPVTTDVVQNVNYSGSGQKSISISRGTTALTALCIVKRLQSAVGVAGAQTLSAFGCFSQTRCQIRLGSRLYPQTASDSLARMYSETRHAYNAWNNQNSGGLVNRIDYESSDGNFGAFTYAYNFRRVLSEEIALDGENTIQAGSIIQYDLTDAPGSSATLTAIIESTRFIELKGSSVSVSGM